MRNQTREPARICRTRFGIDYDHGIPIAELMLEGCVGSWGQAFQMCLSSEEHVVAARSELLVLFGVATETELLGQGCYALRAYDRWGEDICGIEAPNGQRFTRHAFAKRMGYKTQDERETRRKSLLSTVAWTERRRDEALQELTTLDDGYVDWETAP
jgi:hypothetical protein